MIGQVIGIHIKEEALTNGLIDIVKIKPLARCGYKQYTYITEVFEVGSSFRVERGFPIVNGRVDDYSYG